MERKLIFEEILKYVKEGVYIVDTNRQITFWNEFAERITGFSAEEVIGRFCFDNILGHVNEQGTSLCRNGCPLHQTMQDSQNREALVYLHHKQGHRVPVIVRTFPLFDVGRIVGAIELFSSDTSPKQLMKEIEELKLMAMTDQLTGLANRRLADVFLTGKIHELEEFRIPFGVSLVDIDDFKVVNDSYGHDTGDQVIRMVARSLTGAVNQKDLVVRWGGEEFLIVSAGVDGEQFHQTAERMRMLVETSSVPYEGAAISVTISIGSVFVDQKTSKDRIIRMADHLMYRSKAQGKNLVTLDVMS
ncbi:MAG: GGDEF domain-containing protein [Sphaerochaetaceae bacterium]|nr:GGDEF domain-containing protein [Sphaerochaetaceae bacterium]